MELTTADPTTITALWTERWGLPVITSRGAYQPDRVSGLVAHTEAGQLAGLVTWAVDRTEAEIVTIDAVRPGHGCGGTLLEAAEAALAEGGVDRLTVETTNDNLAALGFYVRHGYRLVALHLDAMDAVRARKPQVPLVGLDGIPLRDVLVLEKSLGATQM